MPMKVVHYEQLEAAPVSMQGASGCSMRCLIGPDDAAPSFTMRQFEVVPGGHTPRHRHPYEHEVFVLDGTGVVLEGDHQHALRPGSVVFVPPDQEHQFRNTGSAPLRFLCLIPNPVRGAGGSCVAACGCD